MSTMEARKSLGARTVQYLQERFPPASNGFAAATMALALASAASGHAFDSAPDATGLIAATVVVVGIFLILRICDEFKDAEDDARYRPERPVPRGLVSLRELAGIGAIAAAAQLIVVLLAAPDAWWLLLSAWAWIGLMTKEFFIGHRLKARPVAYLVSHMMVMPFIALLAAAIGYGSVGILSSWIPWGLAGLAFLAGVVMEIGRKIWDVERPGVETYSGLWGHGGAVFAWQMLVSLLIIAVSPFQIAAGSSSIESLPIVVVAMLHLLVVIWNSETNRAAMPQKRIELLSSIYVLMIFITLGAAAWLP